MKVIYIGGPFRAKTPWGVEQNIRRAEELALKVWQSGYVALCPHLNSRYFSGACPDKVWLDGDMELLRRCDAVLLVSGWSLSSGTCNEVEYAYAAGIPVFQCIETLRAQDKKIKRRA